MVGLSILSGSHVPLVQNVMERMREEGLDDVPVVVGGIIPPEDAAKLKSLGVAAVYTPKDFQLNDIMRDIVRPGGSGRPRGGGPPAAITLRRLLRPARTSIEFPS